MSFRPVSILALLALAACGSDSDPALPQEETSSLTVQVTTTGDDLDSDGYTVRLGTRTLEVQADGTVTFDDVSVGVHQVALEGVAANCAVDGGPSRSATVTATGAEVEFSVVCTLSVNDGFTTVACPAVNFAVTAAAPLGMVEIGRLPASMGEPRWARITHRGGGEAAPTLLETREDGTALLLVPLHPSGTAAGGEVIVRLTDGSSACGALRFDVAPLPPATGEFAGVVDALETLIAAQAATLGVTVAELEVEDPLQLPEYLYPLAVAHSVVSGPGPTTSLRDLVNGGLDAETAALLDAVTGRVGLRAELAAQSAALAAGAPAALRQGTMPGSAPLPCATIALGEVMELDECMRAARSARFKETGATGEVLSDLGSAFSMLGLIPTPLTKAVSAIAGVVIWLRQVSLEGASRILPSRFTRLEFDWDEYFQEDEELTGEWRDARVWAASEGWRLDKTVIDAVFQFVGTRGGGFADPLSRIEVLNRVGFPAGEIEKDVANYLLTQIFQKLINNTAGSGFIDVPAKEFGPADVTSLPWTQSAIVAGTSVALTSRRTYEPVEPGTSLLSVKTLDPVNGEFGFQQVPPPGDPVEIVVDQLDLDITPADTTLAPGESATFVVAVSKSAHPEEVEIQGEIPLQGLAAITYDGLNQHTITYLAPQNPDFTKPDLLTVHHTATTGARENGEPRTAVATVRFGSITITPRSACVEPSGEEQFTAEVVGPSDDSVTWEADAGSINSSGLYTAPSTPPGDGTVMIRARSVAIPALRDSVTIRVGGCSCAFTVNVGSFSPVEGNAGDQAQFADNFFGSLRSIGLRDNDMGRTAGFILEADDVLAAPGSAPVVISGQVGTPEHAIQYFTREQDPSNPGRPWGTATLHLTTYEAEKTAFGTVTGTVVLRDIRVGGSSEQAVPFTATFNVKVPDDYTTPPLRNFVCTVQ